MSPQKHDTGYRKRQRRNANPQTKNTVVDGQRLAWKLVNDGLAKTIIVGEISSQRKANQ